MKNWKLYFFLIIILMLAREVVGEDSLRLNRIEENINPSAPKDDYTVLNQLSATIDNYFSNHNIDITTSNQFLLDSLESEIRGRELAYQGNPMVRKLDSLFSNINIASMVDKLTGGDVLMLPVGFTKSVGNSNIELIIPRAKYYAAHCDLEIYCRIKTKDNRMLFFGASDVKYNYETGFSGDVKLGLYADFPLKGSGTNKIGVVIKGASPSGKDAGKGSYVLLDCDGFKEARLEVDLQITTDWILPCDANGTVIQGQRVKANFGITASDLNQMVMDFTLPPFTPTKAKEKVVFMVDQAVLDFSDEINAPGFLMPGGEFQESNKVLPGGGASASVQARAETLSADFGDDVIGEVNTEAPDPGLWRGLYIREFQMIFPQAFKNRDNKERLAAGVEHLYIDSRGLSGGFYVENLLTLEEGAMGNWAYSIDKIGVDINHSQVTGFCFVGGLDLPVTAEGQTFKYGASGNIQKDIYNFSVRLDSTVSFPMLKAGRVKLKRGSGIYVDLIENDFTASARLHGELDISIQKNDNKTDNESEKSSLQIAAVSFSDLIVSQSAPYLGLGLGGYVRFDSLPLLNNSPIQIYNADFLHSGENEYALSFILDVSVMDADDGGGSCTGGTSIVFERSTENKRFQFKKLQYKLMGISLHFGDAGFIQGYIIPFDNGEYGKGYKGTLAGGFQRKDGEWLISLSATAIFGRTRENLKYWYFDAFVSSSEWSVPLIPKVLNANGFGGGAYYHMKMAQVLTPAQLLQDPNPNKPPSGIKYVPDAGTSLGFKASVGLTGVHDNFLGFATLEMAFTSKGGLGSVSFYGRGEFMYSKGQKENEPNLSGIFKSMQEAQAENKAQAKQNKVNKITAAVVLSMRFGEKFEFSGAVEAHLNVLNGYVVGSGMVDIYYSAPKWHFYIGGYADNSIKNSSGVTMGPISAALRIGKSTPLSANLYMLMGNDLPGPPPYPTNVANFFNIKQSQEREYTGDVSGFAMGAGISLDYRSDDKCKSHVKGALGFDFAMLKYANTSYCRGQSGEHGLNYWRAFGRLYAFMDVDASINVWLGCLNLPKFGAGFIIQADVPDPVYLDLYAKLRVAGRNWSIHKEVGNKCVVVN